MLLRFTHLGRSHHLHCLGDLRGVADRFDPAPYVLRVRHLNVWLDYRQAGLKFVERRLHLRLEVLIDLFFLANRLEQTGFACLQVILKLQLVFFDPLDRNSVEVAVLHRPHHSHLFFHRNWVVLFLFKKLDNTLTAIESRSCRRIEIRTKLRKRSELAKLRQIELHFARDLLDRLDLGSGSNAADRQIRPKLLAAHLDKTNQSPDKSDRP